MLRFAVAVAAISLLCWEASAFNIPDSNGNFPVRPGSEFPIDNTITCDRPSSRRVFDASNGALETSPEEPPLLGLIPVAGSQVFLPEPSQFGFPPVDPLPISTVMRLLGFIGRYLEFDRQDISDPTGRRNASLICNLTDPDLPPFGIVDIEDPPASVIYDEMLNTTVDNGVDPMPIGLLDDFPTVLENNLNLLNCDKALRFGWTELPITFFPRYYIGQYCNQRNCAYPAEGEQLCRVDLNPETFVTVTAARWDCCWTVVGRTNQYQCGWRRVLIPIICDCDCVCE